MRRPGRTRNGTDRFIFKILFESKADLDQYMRIWREGSQVIQNESLGAQGTKLHRIEGEPLALCAVAQWHSKASRDRAFKILDARYGPGSVVHSNGRGKVEIIGHMVQIASIFPQTRRRKR